MNLLHLNHCSIQVFSNGKQIRNILSRDNALLKLSFGKNDSTEKNIFENVENIPLYIIFLNEAKRHLIETDPRRAILDLYTAFEGFVNEVIFPKVKSNLFETPKEKFLRTYKKDINNIDETILKTLSGIKDHDEKTRNTRHPPINRILSVYEQEETEPQLNVDDIKKITSLSELRNEAAHGKDINYSKLDDISEGIKTLERVIENFTSNKKG